MTALRCAAALFVSALFLSACDRSGTSASFRFDVQEISKESAGNNLTVLQAGERIYLTYPDLSALSLNLIRLSYPDSPPGGAAGKAPVDTTYLDRISETPELGERFGTCALVLWEGLLNVFYSDREREGPPVLKWISGPSPEGTWWIDILPFSGEPLAVLPAGEDLELYLLDANTLVRRNLRSLESVQLMSPCEPVGDLCSFSTSELQGLTFFDRRSQRLYALLRREQGPQMRAIYTEGAVHHSIVVEGRLRVLVYCPERSTLLLLEEEAPRTGSFVATPVTLCEGTTSVYLGYREGRPYFLYTDRIVDPHGETRYRLSVLAAVEAQNPETGYGTTQLLETPSPVRRIKGTSSGDRLLLFFIEETLKMLVLELDELSSE